MKSPYALNAKSPCISAFTPPQPPLTSPHVALNFSPQPLISITNMNIIAVHPNAIPPRRCDDCMTLATPPRFQKLNPFAKNQKS